VFATDIILSYKQVVPKCTTQLDIFIFRYIQQWLNQDIPVYPVLRMLPIIIVVAPGLCFHEAQSTVFRGTMISQTTV
jgi:hypothetical protein